jgi:hypothetical protein
MVGFLPTLRYLELILPYAYYINFTYETIISILDRYIQFCADRFRFLGTYPFCPVLFINLRVDSYVRRIL